VSDKDAAADSLDFTLPNESVAVTAYLAISQPRGVSQLTVTVISSSAAVNRFSEEHDDNTIIPLIKTHIIKEIIFFI
jgi:hypothetical protein